MVALQNYCPHLGKPLDKGRIRDGKLTCPFHGACFDVDTGLPVAGPSKTAVHRFPSRVLENGDIEVDVSVKPVTLQGAWPL
jgi:nitrite reductase/ring-hydroxylating ferredoxin subunit